MQIITTVVHSVIKKSVSVKCHIICRNSPGIWLQSPTLPYICHQISQIKSTFELFCALF